MATQKTEHLLVILDRDGVINRDSEDYIKCPEEWQPIQGSIEAIAELKRAGYEVAVATNQSGIARGLFTIESLHAIHKKMNSLVREGGGNIDALAVCMHCPQDHCQCRKPMPGLLIEVAKQLDVPLDRAWVVGDSLRDLQAAVAAGAKPVLVKTGNGERTLSQIEGNSLSLTPVFADLKEFAERILAK